MEFFKDFSLKEKYVALLLMCTVGRKGGGGG